MVEMSDSEPNFGALVENCSEPLVCEDGKMIIEGEQPSRQFYIVIEGTVDIFAGERFLESVSAGGVFGEMSLIDEKPASATAIVRGGARLAVIDEPEFLRLVKQSPSFALDLMRVMSGRIRQMDAVSR